MDAQQAILAVADYVADYAASSRYRLIDSEDLAQEALIALYDWCSRHEPESVDEARAMATTCVRQAAGKMHEWATRQCRDVRRTLGGDSLRFNQPSIRPDKQVEVNDTLDATGCREAIELRQAGYEWQEIADRLGGKMAHWRYRVRKATREHFAAA